MSVLPLNWPDKVDSPELLAWLQQFGLDKYIDSTQINSIRDALNELYFSSNPDRIISLGTETIDGNEHTYEGYTWQLDGVQINNIGNPSIIVIPSATVGFKRKDISVFTPTGTIERVAGTETDGEVVTSPDVPEGTLYYKSYDIDGNTIEVDSEPSPIVGTQFKQKNENQKFNPTLGGTTAVITIRPFGQNYYSVVGPVTGIVGFSKALITASPTAEVPYAGKDFYIENKTDHNVALKNAFSPVDIPFHLGADLVVPTNGIVWLKYNPNTEKMDLFFKSWSEVDLSTKADLVGGKVPAAQLPSYVDDILEFANLSAFPVTGETGKIYIALDTNKTYRWSGSDYVQLSSGIDFPSDGKTYGVNDGLAKRIDLMFSNANIQGIANTQGGSAFATIVTAGNGGVSQGTLGNHGYYGSIPFGSISSASTLGSVANYRTMNWFGKTQNSFFVTETFITISNLVAPLTSRMGIGYFGYSWLGNSNSNPSIHSRLCFCNDNGEDFLKLSYKESQSSVVINISLGSLFPARFAKNEHVYLCKFYFLNNKAIATIFDLVTGNYYESPLLNCSWSEGNGLVFVAHINNNTTAEVVSLGFNGFLNKFRYGF